MQAGDRIFVAGHRGLVGSALVRRLSAAGYVNLVTRTHAELDLCDPAKVDQFFQEARPQHVFLAAARVGGIHANSTYPAQFIRDNLAIQTNVILATGSAPLARRTLLDPVRRASVAAYCFGGAGLLTIALRGTNTRPLPSCLFWASLSTLKTRSCNGVERTKSA